MQVFQSRVHRRTVIFMNQIYYANVSALLINSYSCSLFEIRRDNRGHRPLRSISFLHSFMLYPSSGRAIRRGGLGRQDLQDLQEGQPGRGEASR